MQKVPMLRLWKTHETMHINFLPLEKFNKCRKNNYLLQCAQPMSVMEEIRSQRKKLSKKSARTFNQVDDSKSDDELYISHVLRSRQCSYQMPCGASAKGR